PGFTDVLRNLVGKVLKKFPKIGKIPWTPLDRERYVCAGLLPATRGGSVSGDDSWGTSTTRSLANRRPSARIDYGFFVGTSCEEGEKGSNLKGVLPKKVLLVWDCCGLSLKEWVNCLAEQATLPSHK